MKNTLAYTQELVGTSGWTLQLLAVRLVELQVVDRFRRRLVRPFLVQLLGSCQSSHIVSCLTIMPKLAIDFTILEIAKLLSWIFILDN